MNKISRIILIILIAFLGSLGFTQSAQAIKTAGLMVWICPAVDSVPADCRILDDDNHPPLFDESDFSPGQSVSRWVKVANTSGEDQEIGLKMTGRCWGCLYSNNLLSNVLELTIKQGADELQNDFLSNFYGGGERYLSSLSDGAMNTYEFSILFEPESGKNYQGCQTSFDFDIGFWGESAGREVEPGESLGNNTGSGGGGRIIAGLEIDNEQASVNPTKPSIATIFWLTNKLATSRVIWASQDESHNFDWKNPPNYGYPHSTFENSSRVTGHSVDILGLALGTTYYFRCISHASPDTISKEHSFTTLALAKSDEKSEPLDNSIKKNSENENKNREDKTNIQEQNNIVQKQEEAGQNNNNNQAKENNKKSKNFIARSLQKATDSAKKAAGSVLGEKDVLNSSADKSKIPDKTKTTDKSQNKFKYYIISFFIILFIILVALFYFLRKRHNHRD